MLDKAASQEAAVAVAAPPLASMWIGSLEPETLVPPVVVAAVVAARAVVPPVEMVVGHHSQYFLYIHPARLNWMPYPL